MKEVKEEIEGAVETGKVLMGSKKVINSLLMEEPKLVIMSETCPMETAQRIKYYCALAEIPCLVLDESSLQLGERYGKNFRVATLGVLEEGKSNILKVTK